MLYNKLVLSVAAATAVSAQRPTDEPICDFYTKALLKENTAENQATLLTLVVNTVVIGNCKSTLITPTLVSNPKLTLLDTEPNVGIKVPGILAPAKVDNMDVNLMPYFSGELATTNKGGKEGVKVNFLDGGAAEALKKNKPANDDSSNQLCVQHPYHRY